MDVAVVAGVGPDGGLGAALARKFAAHGLGVALAGRSANRLAQLADTITRSGGTAWAIPTDATDPAQVDALFHQAAAHGTIRLAVHNVGANARFPALDMTAADFETLWRQNALSGFLVGTQAVRHLLAAGGGTLIFTGATASLRARPPFLGFAAAKAALRAVAQGLAREFGPQGVHVAHMVIDGVIDGDYARTNFPDFVRAKGSDGLINPDQLADAYWAIHQQPRSTWTHELDLRPYGEGF